MATVNSDLRYRLMGQDVSAGRTFSKVAGEARGAHQAITQLGTALSSTGAFAPLQEAIDAVSTGFQHIQENGKSARVVMQGVGVGITAAGAALLALGSNAQQATAGLKQAIQDAGGVYGDYSKAIEETVQKTATFGRTAGDTENALARLVTATGDPQKALSLMGLTANIAASRNMNLTDSAQMLTSALAGNTRVFRQFGINVGTGKLSADQLNKALDELNQRLAGRAQAQADTFSGKIKALGVEFENAFESLTKFSPLLLTVGASMTIASAAWDLLAKAKERNAAADVANIAGSRKVAVAETEAGAAAAAAAGGFGAGGFGAIGEAGAAGIIGPAFTKGNLLRAGGLAVGGLLAGQLAGTVLGHGAGGSAASDALSLGGTGAGIGLMFGPEGALIGAGIGAAGGALLGLFHHGSGNRGKLEEQQKQLVAQVQQQQKDAITQQFQGYLPGELDDQGQPRAKKIADATEALAKAKTKLTRAQQDLNKASSKGADPKQIEAATARLDAANANLQKALYIGGAARIASAQASVASAQASLDKLHAGPDTTAASRRVADARQAVKDAQKAVNAAKAIPGLTAAQFAGRLGINLKTEQQMAADNARLVDKFNISQPVLAQIDALDKQIPGTLHRVASTMTKSLAERLNKDQEGWDAASKAFTDAAERAFTKPAQAIGAQMADDQISAYQKRLQHWLLQHPTPASRTGAIPQFAQSNAGGLREPQLTGGGATVMPGQPGYQASGGRGDFGGRREPQLTGAGSTAQPGQSGFQAQPGSIYIGTVNVDANDPNKFTRELAGKARQRALSGGPATAVID